MSQQQFPCKQCGALVEFKPGSESLACPYCQFENPIPQSEADIHELDFHAMLQEMEYSDEAIEIDTLKCGECGAGWNREGDVTSTECPFCGTPAVIDGGSTRELKPASLLPFHIDKKQAMEMFKAWIISLWFAPNKLKHYARADKGINGMYVPYWTYDSYVTTGYSGQCGIDHRETYTDSEGKTQSRSVTRWHSVSGVVFDNFDDVLVLASESLPRKYTEKLEPWDLENLVPYQDAYLSGFRAENYQIDLEGGFEYAKGIMATTIHKTICRDIGGDHQRVSSSTSQYDNVTFKHVLLPLWISAYRYQDKSYRFLVNARTGEVQGERPWSWVKIGLAITAGVAVVGGIIALIASSS